MRNAKVTNRPLLIFVVAVLLLALSAYPTFAGVLARQYSGVLNYGQWNAYYSGTFYINTGIVSITGWQYGEEPGVVARLNYVIVQKTWYGYKEITSPKVVDGNYYPSYWFSPIRFYDIPQNTQLALEIYLGRYVTSEFGGNIYDGA